MATRTRTIEESFCDMPGCSGAADCSCEVCGKDLCYEHSTNVLFLTFCPECYEKAKPVIDERHAASIRAWDAFKAAMAEIGEEYGKAAARGER